jgi:putative FmdB family regulatory protein
MLYEYRCIVCHEEFEELVNEYMPWVRCPTCGEFAAKKQPSKIGGRWRYADKKEGEKDEG